MFVHLALLNQLMGIPPGASEQSAMIDQMIEFCHWFMLLLFVGWLAYFLYALFRFHHTRNPKADYHGVKSKISAHLEFSVVMVEAALLLGFAIPLWGRRVNEFPDAQKENALRVHVIAEQFAWHFHYPGPDGIFGRQDPKFVSQANPIGLDPEDPAGKDDLLSKNEVHLLNHRPTVFEVTSKDVIHSLALQHMRAMQDAIPGVRVPMWFRPIKAGQYEVICAQLCGAGHYSMKAQMFVDDQASFDSWVKETTALQHPPTAPAAAPAPAGVVENPAAKPTPVSTGVPAPAAK